MALSRSWWELAQTLCYTANVGRTLNLEAGHRVWPPPVVDHAEVLARVAGPYRLDDQAKVSRSHEDPGVVEPLALFDAAVGHLDDGRLVRRRVGAAAAAHPLQPPHQRVRRDALAW